jgi:pilus assembly protein CpaF
MGQLVGVFDQTIRHLLGPIRDLLDDASISEVMINGPDEVYIERAGRLQLTDRKFADAAALEAAMRNVAQYVGKRLTAEELSIEARLPDGSRVHMLRPPAARNGLCVAIRKFSKTKLDLDALVQRGALTAHAAEFLGIAVALAKNVIVSGGTGSGKTTLLNCLSGMIPAGERIIVIEDSSELRLLQDHVLYFEVQAPDRNGRGGISVRDLFRGSLRMRPDRIVVGECRGGEALDMIQAMTSGHSGSLSTCHANTPVDALGRLETMAMMGGVEFPLHALRTQLASAIDLIVQVSRFRDGSRKIESIAEVLDLDEAGRYRLAEIYQFRARGVDAEGKVQGELEWTGRQPRFAEEPFAKGFAERIGLTAGLWRRPAADAPEGSPPVQDQEAR